MSSFASSSDYEQVLTLDVVQLRSVQEITDPKVVHNVLASNGIKFSATNVRYRVLQVDINVFQLRVNWHQIATDLKQSGVSFQQQARTIGKPWSSYQRWLEGGEPGFGEGQALLILHSKFCGIGLTQQRLSEAKSVA